MDCINLPKLATIPLMRFKTTTIGLGLTLLLCSFALLPLLRSGGLPSGYDVLYHVYRVAEMQRSWEAGVFLPRWADSFYFGYGYPVFHYYASVTYYLTSILISLTGMSALAALRGVIALSLLGGGVGMYGFCRPRWGVAGAVLAAVVYVYSPYLLYTEPYTRGDYPELLSFGLIPWVFWAFDALAAASRPRAVVLAAGSVALLIQTHNLMALVFFAILCGWLVWRWCVGELSKRHLGLLLGVAGLGVGLSAYFWLPVLAERDAVQLDNLIALAELDYRHFFVPLGDLLALPPRSDAGAMNGLLPRYHLGVAGWLLGLLGVGVVWHRRRRAEVFFAVLGGLCIFLMTPQAAGVWERLSILAYLQFPWRFLGAAAFCAAVLAGGVGQAATAQRWRLPLLTVLYLLPLVAVIPLFYVPQWDLKDVDTSTAAYQAAEVAGLQRGTTFSGEYLPVNVFVVPDPNQRLLADFADGSPIDKSHWEILPNGVALTLLSQNPHHAAWRVQAEAPFTLEVLTFDFPGWRARVNGAEVPITPAVPHGFITFPVPSGESLVQVEMSQTAPRWLGYGVSLAAVLGVLGAGLALRRATPPTKTSGEDVPSPYQAVILTTVAFTIILGVVFRPGIAWLESPPGEAHTAQHPTAYSFGDDIRLLGYDLSAQTLHPGDTLDLALYWYAAHPLAVGYASFVHISNGGPPLAQSDRQNPGGIPSKTWTPSGGYIYDAHSIELPAWMPLGEYQIVVGLWTCDGVPAGESCGNGLRPMVQSAEGEALGDSLPLINITLK